MLKNKRLIGLVIVLALLAGGMAAYWLSRPSEDSIRIAVMQIPPRGRAAERDDATMAVVFNFPRPFDLSRVRVETAEPVDPGSETGIYVGEPEPKLMWELTRDPEADEGKPEAIKSMRYGQRAEGMQSNLHRPRAHRLVRGVAYRLIVESHGGLRGEAVFTAKPYPAQ